MVLALLVGVGLRVAFGWAQAPVFGFLVGLVVAPLVPGRGSCPLPDRRMPRDDEGHDAGSSGGDHARS